FALMVEARRVRPSMCSSPKMPSWPGKPCPRACTCEAQVMVSAKPPSARMVSQRNSSSERQPSGWLWQLVSGASMKRFFIAGPRVSVSGSNSLALDMGTLRWLAEAVSMGGPDGCQKRRAGLFFALRNGGSDGQSSVSLRRGSHHDGAGAELGARLQLLDLPALWR